MSRNNPLLVIHDSGGFEAAETSNLNEIKRFITHCTSETELEKQLHCIWYGKSKNTSCRIKLKIFLVRYCIECHDPRFWSEAETQFLEFFRKSPIPIVFVLTKFDMVVNQCLVDRLKTGGRDVVNWTSIETLAVGDAKEKIKEKICRTLERIVGGGIKAEIVSKESMALYSNISNTLIIILRPAFGKEACRGNNKGGQAESEAAVDRSPTCCC
jgi:hypothetical protein